MHLLIRTFIVAAGWVLGAQAASAQVVWDEGINGDLSSDRLNPTSLSIASGSNTLLGTVGVGGDLDYFKFTLPVGMSLTAITHVAYSGVDGTAFIGLQSGATFTVTPGTATPGVLLGYAHFGPNQATVGTDILDNIGSGAGSIGFISPLPAGTYTFWVQQASATATSYQFNFQAIPEPGTVALISGLVAFAAAAAVRSVRRRKALA